MTIYFLSSPNRLQETFFIDDDYQEYLHFMAEWFIRCKAEVWSYCLMPNMVEDWKQFLSSTSDNELDAIRKHERTGRPLGGDNFLSLLEEKPQRLKGMNNRT